MRCPVCNKFASYDDGTEPEVDVDLRDDGSFTGQVRIVLTHDECGTELKEASFEFEGQVPPEVLEAHSDEEHNLELECDSPELTQRGEGSGRYMKTFYGYSATVNLTCDKDECRKLGELWTADFDEDVQASYMDELT